MKQIQKKSISILLLFVLTILLGSSYINRQSFVSQRKGYQDAVKEEGLINQNTSVFRGDIKTDLPPPANRIPGLDNFMDYTTNGNSLSQLILSGDTIIAITTYCDSLDAPDANNGSTLRIRYNVSYNKGVTWSSTTGLNMTSDQKSRYPDSYLMTIGGGRTLNSTGRYWLPPASNTTRRAGTSHDVLLGIGSPTTTLNTAVTGTDLFSTLKSDNRIGCILQRPSSTTQVNDSIWYFEFNPNTHTFGSKLLLENRTLNNTVMSSTIKAATAGTHMTAGWIYINEPGNGGDNWRSFRVKQSTDNGLTWSATTKWGFNAATPNILGGDSCQMYWHEDVEYKPGTLTPYLVFSTYPYVWTGTGTGMAVEANKGWKIMIQSPALNSNIPVTVADWHNIEILGNLTLYNMIVDWQVNSALLSHPSVGFSTDGSVIWVTYSVIQKEVCPSPALPFNYFDVYVSKSTNGGLNWSIPINLTNTTAADEMYPVVAPQNNSVNFPCVAYNWDAIPGCHSFTDLQIVDKVYYCLYKDSMTAITPISEVAGRFGLMQNYPNPFNPSTKIKFSISSVGDARLRNGQAYMRPVQLIIYDILGREVAMLVNEKLKSGSYEVEWNGSNYPSGVYFYRLVAGDYTSSKKMIMVK